MDKNKYRCKIHNLLSGFDESYIMESDELIFDRLCDTPEVQNAGTIFAYVSIGREVDTRCFIHHCLDLGKRVALPACKPDGRMLFRLYDRKNALVTAGPYNIPEPSVTARLAIPTKGDVILVPALCYDKLGNRLGHGVGYYDRFLADCPALSIGLCREELIMPDVPIEPHDVPVSLLITETKTRGR